MALPSQINSVSKPSLMGELMKRVKPTIHSNTGMQGGPQISGVPRADKLKLPSHFHKIGLPKIQKFK